MKVFVIGIDGANLELIRKWENDLPNLRKMIREGVYGKLESTIPPATSPAWNCMFTGMNPGKLGIYDLYMFPFYRKEGIVITNYSYQDSPSVWDILSSQGKRVGIMNVPTTFPPTKVNGFMISGGLLTPFCSDTNYTYPPELKEKLNQICQGYEILPFTDLTISGKEEEFLQKFHQNVDKHLKALKYLMGEFEWDFLTYVFFVTDSVQHYFWHHLDENHPAHDKRQAAKYGGAIKEIYQKVDSAIGELKVALPAETNLIVVSDHGSGPLFKEFLINEWLRRQGLLKLKKNFLDTKGIFAVALLQAKNLISKVTNSKLIELAVKVMPKSFLKRFLMREQYKYQAIQLIENVDWSKTLAYGFGSSPQIFINLKGREFEGIVEPDEYERLRRRIKDLLLQIRDPETGEKIVTAVFKKEEVYCGKHLDAAPDLLVVMGDFSYVPRAGFGRNIWIKPRTSGAHSKYGVFIAYGPDIRKDGKELKNLVIYDITPTILHMFGLPVPKNMDGRVLIEIFEKNSEPAKRPVIYQEVVNEQERIVRKIKEIKKMVRRI